MKLCMAEEDLLVNEAGRPLPMPKQTPSLGLKQHKVRCMQRSPTFIAGTADETHNQLSVWTVNLQDDQVEPHTANPALMHSIPHRGDVLDIDLHDYNQSPTVFTASGEGRVQCYSVESQATCDFVLCEAWSVATASPALGVAYGSEKGCLAAVSEDGSLIQLDASLGKQLSKTEKRGSSLLGVHWHSPHQVATVGSCVLLWDFRLNTGPVAQFEAISERDVALNCAATNPHKRNILSAGSSKGEIFFWDTRFVPHTNLTQGQPNSLSRQKIVPHTADIWGVQFYKSGYGDLFSCSSDGNLLASHIDDADAFPRPVVTFDLPVNSFDISDAFGALVAASDSEVLTVVDLRA